MQYFQFFCGQYFLCVYRLSGKSISGINLCRLILMLNRFLSLDPHIMLTIESFTIVNAEWFC